MGLDAYITRRDYHDMKKDENGNYIFGKWGEPTSWYESHNIGYFRNADILHNAILNQTGQTDDNWAEINLTQEDIVDMMKLFRSLLDEIDGMTLVPSDKTICGIKNHNKMVDDGKLLGIKKKWSIPENIVFNSNSLETMYDAKLQNYTFEKPLKKNTKWKKITLVSSNGHFTDCYGADGWLVYDILKAYLMFKEIAETYFNGEWSNSEFYYKAS